MWRIIKSEIFYQKYYLSGILIFLSLNVLAAVFNIKIFEYNNNNNVMFFRLFVYEIIIFTIFRMIMIERDNRIRLYIIMPFSLIKIWIIRLTIEMIPYILIILILFDCAFTGFISWKFSKLMIFETVLYFIALLIYISLNDLINLYTLIVNKRLKSIIKALSAICCVLLAYEMFIQALFNSGKNQYIFHSMYSFKFCIIFGIVVLIFNSILFIKNKSVY
jgi:hypothetical protein